MHVVSISLKSCFTGVIMTPYCDVTSNVYAVTMTPYATAQY